MRGDLALNQLAEKRPRAVGDVGGDPIRYEVEALLHPIEHVLRRIDLFRDPCRRRIDIDDHAVQQVDQVIDAVGELHLMATACRPRCGRVGR